MVTPIPIEQALMQAPLIDLAIVIADKRKFTTCLLFPDFEILESLKIAQKKEKLSDTQFLDSEFVQNEMKTLLEAVNAKINHWEQVQYYRFVIQAPTIEGGELTPTMKPRRDIILDKYADIINDMYKS